MKKKDALARWTFGKYFFEDHSKSSLLVW